MNYLAVAALLVLSAFTPLSAQTTAPGPAPAVAPPAAANPATPSDETSVSAGVESLLDYIMEGGV